MAREIIVTKPYISLAKVQKKTTVTVHNKISPNYKGIHVDGAYGGITPHGQISLSFFAERAPIPKSSDFEIKGSKIGAFIKNSDDTKTGILREFEFGIYMAPDIAKAIIALLQEHLSRLDEIQNQHKDDSNK